MSEPYKEELDTLASVFGTPWNPQTLAAVLTHFGGDLERATDSILEHGDGDPNLLVLKLNASRGPADVDAAQHARDYSVGKAHGSGQKPSSKAPEMVVGSNPSPDERARLERRLQMRESAVKAAKTAGKSQDGGPSMMDIYKSAPTMIPASDHLPPEQSVPLKRAKAVAKARGGRSALTDKIKAGPEVLSPTNPEPPAPFADRSSSPSRNSKSSNVEVHSGRNSGGILSAEEEKVEESPLSDENEFLTGAAGVNIGIAEDSSGAAEDGIGTSHEQEEVVPAGRGESTPMVSAVLVSDDENIQAGTNEDDAGDYEFVDAIPLNESDRGMKWKQILRNRWVLVFLLVVVVAIVGLSLGLVMGGGSGDNVYQSDRMGENQDETAHPSVSTAAIPTTEPMPESALLTLVPTSSPQTLQELLCSALPRSCPALSDQSTPQYAALTWLLSDPNLELYSESRKKQRYAIATLFYGIDGWEAQTNWLDYSGDECDWNGVSCSSNGINRIELESKLDPGGLLPVELVLLKESLVVLDLMRNNMRGTIPSEYGQLERLRSLKLSVASLTGTIPTEIGQLQDLVHLTLWNTKLFGTIPTELGMLSMLEVLFLAVNSLSGTIPSVVGQLTNLRSLGLYKNGLSGSVPLELSRLHRLVYLDFRDNNLTGRVPDELCSSLVSLNKFEADCLAEIECNCCTECS